MTDAITPGREITFKITAAPRREAQRKTIQRLMRLQPHVQNGLRKLAKRRRRQDNRTYIRAGNEWVNRKRTTKLTWVRPGETFTIFVTPQIVPDLQSVAEFLETS